MTKPKVLILDEPTAGVSPIIMDELFDRIIEVSKTGISILMVEQNAKQALNIADKGFVLSQGVNKFSGTGVSLLNNSEVRKIISGWLDGYIECIYSSIKLCSNSCNHLWKSTCVWCTGSNSYLWHFKIFELRRWGDNGMGAMFTILFTWLFQSLGIVFNHFQQHLLYFLLVF